MCLCICMQTCLCMMNVCLCVYISVCVFAYVHMVSSVCIMCLYSEQHVLGVACMCTYVCGWPGPRTKEEGPACVCHGGTGSVALGKEAVLWQLIWNMGRPDHLRAGSHLASKAQWERRGAEGLWGSRPFESAPRGPGALSWLP